jgi:RNA binding exosome subunit
MGFALEDSIRQIVKDIDARFDCYWNRGSERYVITQRGPFGNVMQFDSVRYDNVTKGFFDHIREVVYENRNGHIWKDMEENNYKAERRKAEKEEEDTDYLIKSTAPTLRRAIREL